MTSPGRVIAILGAESSGKTRLAQELAQTLAARGLSATWVPETLREWCDARGRTPRRDEQIGIARAQSDRIAAAAALHDWVVADTSALMTAVYSRFVFGDTSLDAEALRAHRTYAATLLTALDLPWRADGIQRDGPQVREPVDRLLRELLTSGGITFELVSGSGAQRLLSALRALSASTSLAGLTAPPLTPAAGSAPG